MSAAIKARFVAKSSSHLACTALICDPLEGQAAVTGASLAADLQGLTALQIQQRLLAYGVQSTLDSCADLQAEIAERGKDGAAAIVQPHHEHAASRVVIDDLAKAHPASVATGSGQ